MILRLRAPSPCRHLIYHLRIASQGTSDTKTNKETVSNNLSCMNGKLLFSVFVFVRLAAFHRLTLLYVFLETPFFFSFFCYNDLKCTIAGRFNVPIEVNRKKGGKKSLSCRKYE